MLHETTWYLEMLSPDQHRPGRVAPDLDIRRLEVAVPAFNKFLWLTVGKPWQSWNSRVEWTDHQWEQLSLDSNVHTWVGYVGGAPAGFFELSQTATTGVEIAFFGLLPQFIGKGYGGHLLSEAIARAWELGTERVWVHTCEFDAPQAMNNYKARGFVHYDTKVMPTIS